MKEIEDFLLDSKEFRDIFQPSFVEYFVTLCQSYDKYYSQDILEDVANTVYKDIFEQDIFITTYENDVFRLMLEDGVMLGFLINRSMFFLLENYIKDSNDSEKCKPHIKTIVQLITEYINQFEKDICERNRIQPIHINFDTLENFSAGKNIMDIFKDIKDRGDEVTFFNLYKGIPIQHQATIMDVGDNEVVFRTMQTQEMAMKMDEVAYILKDDNFDKYLKASIKQNNFANNTVVLENFTYLLNMPAKGREFARVHPDIMVEVALLGERELVTKGKLFDLSINGLGVVSEENNGIYAGAKIALNFVLEISNLEEKSEISVEAEVINIIEYSNSYRYCIKIHSKVETENRISKYVKAREVEIIDSLNQKLKDYK